LFHHRLISKWFHVESTTNESEIPHRRKTSSTTCLSPQSPASKWLLRSRKIFNGIINIVFGDERRTEWMSLEAVGAVDNRYCFTCRWFLLNDFSEIFHLENLFPFIIRLDFHGMKFSWKSHWWHLRAF
jgi:hypothetical protein